MQVRPFVRDEDIIRDLRAKGMLISNPNAALEYLKDYSAFSVIDGHSDLLLEPDGSGNFKPGTSFVEMRSLHHFDESLRRCLMHYVLRVEAIVKSNAIYAFCDARDSLGNCLHASNGYLDRLNYDRSRPYPAQKAIDAFREALRLGTQSPGPIRDYQNADGAVPLWVVATGMTFGHTLHFYRALMPAERDRVARRFSLRDAELESFLTVLRDFRNVLAHNGRTYSFHTVHRTRDVLRSDGSVERVEAAASRRLGSVLFVLSFLLPQKAFSSLIHEISTLCCGLSSKLKTITIGDVAAKMGTPLSMRIRYHLTISHD